MFLLIMRAARQWAALFGSDLTHKYVLERSSGYNLPMMKRLDWIALILVVLFVTSGVLTLSHYGLSWDEGLGNIFFGERYFLYLTSFEEKFLDFKNELPYHRQTPWNTFNAPFKNFPNQFPPATDIFSAAGMFLSAYWLNIFNPVDGWHFFTVIISGIFLWLFYRFFSVQFGKARSLAGLFFLASFPRFWADMHFNPKDVPEMIWISLVVMVYYLWYENPAYWKAILTGVLFAFALGTKANALIVPFIILAGVWSWQEGLSSVWENFYHVRNRLGDYGLMLISSLIVYFFNWPYLHSKPIRMVNYFSYIFTRGSSSGEGVNGEVWLQMITTMPEIMVMCLLFGLGWLMFSKKLDLSPWARILPVWLLLPLVRASLPGMINFDGIRHFMEYLPAAALIAGIGLVELIRWINTNIRVGKIAVSSFLVAAVLLNYLFVHLSFFPFQHIYYNQLIGGLPGAAEVFGLNEATDYWAVSYRRGMSWIDENAPEGAVLYTPVAPHLVDLTAPLWLRSELEVWNQTTLEQALSHEAPVYVMFITRPVFYDPVAEYCLEQLKPKYSIAVDGLDVMRIYLLD